MTDERNIEIEPRYYDFYMDGVRWVIPNPTLGFRVRRWRDTRTLRHTMLAVKRLFDKYVVPPIEKADTVELVEANGEYWLRIRGVDNG